MGSHFLENNQIRVAAAATSSGTTTISSSVVDTAGFNGVAFACTITTANAGNFIKLQHGDAADGSDMVDLAGTAVVAAANGQLVVAEIARPSRRYVRAQVVRGSATALGEILCLQLDAARSLDVSNNVPNVIISEFRAFPVAGTA